MIMNRILNKIKAPLPVPDRMLEYAAGLLVIITLVVTSVLYTMAPDTVPTHFTFNGVADSWSDKSFYWETSVVFVIFMVIIFFTAYNPEYAVRIPVGRRKMNAQQKFTSARAFRVLNVSIGITWLVIEISASSEFLGISGTLLATILFVTVALIVVPSLYYAVKVMRQR